MKSLVSYCSKLLQQQGNEETLRTEKKMGFTSTPFLYEGEGD